MDNNLKHLYELFQFVDFIHHYFFFNNYQDLASDIIYINEKMQLLKPEESFKDKVEYEGYEKSFESKLELIKKNIFQPAENEANKFNIFIFIDDDYDPYGIMEERHYDYLLNSVYQNTLDEFKFKSKSPLPLPLKRKMLKYIELRENIILCSHILSRMILCFDFIVNDLLNFYNIKAEFHKTMYKPFKVINKYSNLNLFYPHLIGINELKSEIQELIYRTKEHSYTSTLDPQILGLTLNDFYIDLIQKHLNKISKDERNYLVDDILDLSYRLKQSLESQSSHTFVDNFSKKISDLIDKKDNKSGKINNKIAFVDFFFNEFKSKSNDLYKEFNGSSNRKTAILIYLLVENKIITIERNGLSRLKFSNFIQNKPNRTNIAGINAYFDSSSPKKIAFNNQISDIDEDYIKLKNRINRIFNLN